MKSDFDQEMDSLLRGHARRARRAFEEAAELRARADDTSQSAASLSGGSMTHLDADELSAYAENALPAPTRARFMSHLADCDECRRSVTRLVLASGVANELEKRAAVAPSKVVKTPAWRERLVALFSPRAWRYVVPVVALAFVGIVSFIALRADRESKGVSGRAAKSTVSTPASDMNHAAGIEESAETQMANTETTSTTTTSAVGANNSTSTNAATTTAHAPSKPQQNGELEARTDSLSAEERKRPSTDSQPPPPIENKEAQSANAPSAPAATNNAAPSIAPESNNVRSLPTLARNQQEMSNNQQVTVQQSNAREANRSAMQSERGNQTDRDRLTQSDNATNDAAQGGAAAQAPKTKARREVRARNESETSPGARKAQPQDDKREKDNSNNVVETRTVAGHQFHREGGAWVDANYNSGQATVTVKRGSEQYRALIADEPALGRIADALGGEVIIVWHGRAYRIKP